MRALLGRFVFRREAGFAAAGLVTAMGAGVTLAWPRTTSPGPPTAVVREAPFADALVERGTIDAARMMLYGSAIAGSQAKILELAAEGAAVDEGDVLIRFDAAPFEEAAARAEAARAQADAELVRAREDLRLEDMRAATDLRAAGEQVGFAERALATERDAKGPLAVAEAEAAAREAARDLDRTRASFEDTRALLADGFVTRIEVERAEQAMRQAADRRQIADLRLEALRAFEQPAALDKSRAELNAARKSVETVTDAARSRLTQRRAAVALAAARADDARLRLAQAREHVARTIVRSATPGLVVHRELFFGTDKRKPQPGDEVWPNQPIVAVPDPAQLVVQTRVREVDLHRVTSSQRVLVWVDAYPDVRLPATVGTIGALAQDDPTRAGTRFFPVTIRLSHADARLRTGMTARVEIEVGSMPRAIVVPVEALVEEDGGVTKCRVIESGRIAWRAVDVAARNDLVAAIARGLAPGETVVIGDPARGSAR